MKWHNLIAVALFTVTGAFAQTVAPVEGQDYTIVASSIAPLEQNKDKIEVVEFFSYVCSHCRNLDFVLREYAKKLPQDTVYRSEHIVWDEGMYMSLAKLKSTVSKLHLENQLNAQIYKALFDDKKEIFEPKILEAWLATQPGIDSKYFMEIYNSFATAADANRMKELTKKHEVNATPIVIVGGKYQVVDSRNMQLITALVEKVRKERNMSDPQTLFTPKASSPAIIFK